MPSGDQPIAAASTSFAKVGNQAVHVANATGELPPDLARIAAYVENLLMQEVEYRGA